MDGLTDQQIVERGLELARAFYKAHGYEVEPGYRFDLASHPQERVMWNLAVIAMDHLSQTDLAEVLENWIDETAGNE